MKYRIYKDDRQNGEMEVQGEYCEKLIMIDAKTINSGDFHIINRWYVDCMDEAVEAPEFLYSITYMPDGYSSYTYVVGEDDVSKILDMAKTEIMHCSSSGVSKILEKYKDIVN